MSRSSSSTGDYRSIRSRGELRHDSDELLSLVYGELRKLARSMMAHEKHDTPRPTELVHEAYLRLGGDPDATWRSRAHFFGAAAEAMRRILVERARRRTSEKHGGGRRRVPLSQATADWDSNPGEILDLHEAMTKLEELAPRVAAVVKLRYFVGLTIEETAATLEISSRTVKRDWARAKTWLYQELNPGRSSSD